MKIFPVAVNHFPRTSSCCDSLMNGISSLIKGRTPASHQQWTLKGYSTSTTSINTHFRHYSSNLSATIGVQDSDDVSVGEDEGSGEKPRKSRKNGTGGVPHDDPATAGKLPNSKSTHQAILSYLKEQQLQPELSDLIPKQFIRGSSQIPNSVYLVNKSVAGQMAEFIAAERLDPNSPILEIHPGLGLLTNELVGKLGFKYVTCLEDDLNLGQSLKNRFGIAVIDGSLDDIPRHHHLDKHDGGERIFNFLNQIVTEPEVSKDTNKEKPKLYVVGMMPHISSINFLIRSYVTHRIFYEEDTRWAGVTFLIAIGCKSTAVCEATPKSGLVLYRPTSVFFQTLFKTKEIGVLPREAFIPWEIQETKKTGQKTRRIKLENPDIVKFVRVDANPEVMNKLDKEDLFNFWYFVRQCLHARKQRVIPELEKWVPGCGIRLIKQGFTIYSIFGDLESHQLLDLYLQFVSWPEFANSSFLNAVEKYQTKLEILEEDDSVN